MASAQAVAAETTLTATEPYVGPRPFRGHEAALFHGRDTDARILCDRVLGARLTVLYAQSGLGKSSLLQTRVIPLIEEQGATVFYFDSWSQRDPLGTLKQALGEWAANSGVADPLGGSPTLAQLVQLISSYKGSTITLIFDQFEEFLVRGAEQLDPLRSELANLVRSRADAAVVLTLREEYLAALEPFRERLPNLFESAHRLEELPQKDLREAILKPPEKFGGKCEEALADQLIADLKAGSAEAAGDARAAFVGLPMLQLVCQELWKRAGDAKELKLHDYESYGRAQRIIDDYVTGLMPSGQRERVLAAGLLRHLAPRSGLKNPCAVEDLVEPPFEASEVEAQLKRLSEVRILRTRDYNTGVVYELQHDAFIRVLRAWRDDVLQEERHRRDDALREQKRQEQIRRFAVGTALAILLFGVGVWTRENSLREEANAQRKIDKERADNDKNLALQKANAEKQMDLARAEAEGKRKIDKLQADQQVALANAKTNEMRAWLEGAALDELSKEKDERKRRVLAPSYFEVVTSYLLWKEADDPHNLSKLQKALESHERLLPASYGLRFPETGVESKESPLTIEYSSSRGFDTKQFMVLWRDYAKEIGKVYGLAVPLAVKFKKISDLDPDSLRVLYGGPQPLTIHAPTYGGQVMFRFKTSELKDTRARDFLEHFVKLAPFESDSRWLLAPRWSLPVWRVAREIDGNPNPEVATDGSGLGAYHVLTDLLSVDEKNIGYRRALVTRQAVDELLYSAKQRFPATVEMALLERSNCLVDDLAAKVEKDRYALLDLPLALDLAADKGRCEERATPATGQRGSQTQVAASSDGNTRRLLAPRTAQLAALEPSTVFAGLESSLPISDSRLWVYGSQSIGPAAEGRIRENIYRKYGLIIPTIQFAKEWADRPSPGAVLRVEPKPGQEATLEIQRAAEEDRGIWISAESTAALLDHLPKNTRDWIRTQYSLTSVEKVLRTTAVKSEATDGGIRYASWLLPTLCFWATLEGDEAKMNRERIAGDLLDTQRARLNRASAVNSTVRQTISEGANALAAGNVERAIGNFKEAANENPAAARKAFLSVWPDHLVQTWIYGTREHFADLKKLDLETGERVDLADLHPGNSLVTPEERDLAVYRLASGVTAAKNRQEQLAVLLDGASDRTAHWPLPEERYVALEFLKEWDPVRTDARGLERLHTAGVMLKDVVVSSPSQSDAYDAFLDLLDVATRVPNTTDQYRDIPTWAWQILNDLAAARSSGSPGNLPFELAWRLADEERPERLKNALALMAAYEKVVASSSLIGIERAQQQDLITYARARSYWSLAAWGDESNIREAEKLFRQVLASKWITAERADLAQVATARLVEILADENRSAEAQSLWANARKKWSSSADTRLGILDGGEVMGQLAALNAAAAAEAAARAAERTEDTDSMFFAALGSILTQTNNWRDVATRFLESDKPHPYKDYVGMTLYAFDGGGKSRAASYLARRWKEIEPRKNEWQLRLKNGDTSAWREVLVGRFFGAPETADLLDTVDNEDRWKQTALTELPMTRRSMQTEAWFYDAMRARGDGDFNRMRADLRRVIDASVLFYEENRMARFILGASNSSSKARVSANH